MNKEDRDCAALQAVDRAHLLVGYTVTDFCAQGSNVHKPGGDMHFTQPVFHDAEYFTESTVSNDKLNLRMVFETGNGRRRTKGFTMDSECYIRPVMPSEICNQSSKIFDSRME